jgi:hypothetical protein
MKKQIKRSVRLPVLATVLFLLLLVTPRTVQATLIIFEATDLADVSAGEDLWRYIYQVSGFSFAANEAFEILFDRTLYTKLKDPPPAVAGWDILSIQPDPSLPDDGRYSALALSANPSLAGPFSISFVWLGGGGISPGSQPFEINQFDNAGNIISTLETGVTRNASPVPEPNSPGWAAMLLLTLLILRKKKLIFS